MARSQRRTALFYDAPLSTPEDIGLLKSMLLFFDDIAVFSTPGYRSGPPTIDPYLAAPLTERGLLQFVDPRVVLASQTDVVMRATLHRAAMQNAEQWLAAAVAGDWDLDVPRLQGRLSDPLAIGTGHMSAPGDRGTLELFKYLAQDGWLLPEESTEEWLLTPGSASVANSILAQAVRTMAGQQGQLIDPVATRRDEARVFTAILEGAVENVSASDVVMSGLSAAALDLSRVGLDDILDFRSHHRIELRAYLLAVRALLAPAPTSPDASDRKAALGDEANRLCGLQRRRWPNVGATVSLGITGAAWTLGGGDLLGALIGGPTAGAHVLADRPIPVSAYTYLVRPDAELAG